MKQSEIKKILKKSTCSVSVTESQQGIFSARLLIERQGVEFSSDKNFLIIDAQANDLKDVPKNLDGSSVTGGNESPKNVFRHLSGVGRFYGVHIDTRVDLDLGMGRDNTDPKRAQVVFDLVSKVVEDKNLYHVTNCVLTQVVTALESLGCKLTDVEIDRKSVVEWNRQHTVEQEV